MKPWTIACIIVVVGVVLVMCFNTPENYGSNQPFRSQWYAKGFGGPGFTEGQTQSQALGGQPGIPKTFSWSGKGEIEGGSGTSPLVSLKDQMGPASTTGYSTYSMYSTKVWPTTYRPCTNTCFDEYMRSCSPGCNVIPDSRSCLEECQLKATRKCSQRINIPKMVNHHF